jgi:hypothetical protein
VTGLEVNNRPLLEPVSGKSEIPIVIHVTAQITRPSAATLDCEEAPFSARSFIETERAPTAECVPLCPSAGQYHRAQGIATGP